MWCSVLPRQVPPGALEGLDGPGGSGTKNLSVGWTSAWPTSSVDVRDFSGLWRKRVLWKLSQIWVQNNLVNGPNKDIDSPKNRTKCSPSVRCSWCQHQHVDQPLLHKSTALNSLLSSSSESSAEVFVLCGRAMVLTKHLRNWRLPQISRTDVFAFSSSWNCTARSFTS